MSPRPLQQWTHSKRSIDDKYIFKNLREGNMQYNRKHAKIIFTRNRFYLRYSALRWQPMSVMRGRV